jgi:hypothetical protein
VSGESADEVAAVAGADADRPDRAWRRRFDRYPDLLADHGEPL